MGFREVNLTNAVSYRHVSADTHRVDRSEHVIERRAIAGRARRRATDALLAAVPNEQLAKLDRPLMAGAAVNMTPFVWLRVQAIGAPERTSTSTSYNGRSRRILLKSSLT